MDGRRLARLQRAGQLHRVARRAALGDAVSPLIDQVAVSASLMVVVTEPLPATLEPVVLPGLDSATVYCSGPSTRPSLIAARLMTRLHRAAGAGVGQRAGAGIEAQIGAADDRRGHRRAKPA